MWLMGRVEFRENKSIVVYRVICVGYGESLIYRALGVLWYIE